MTDKIQNKLPGNKQTRIVKQLLYYDIFDHLLTEEELVKDCSLTDDPESHFDDLVNKGLIFKMNGYYSVRKDKQLALKRERGQANTENSMPRARKMAGLIGKFPFIRAVALSGSISKGYMDSYKDIDYFIITKPGRLWLARTILVFYKKVFLLDSFKYFCLNYFVDENTLEIEDRNVFTATEINTLIPVYGVDLLHNFYQKNEWVSEYYNEYPQKDVKVEDQPPNPRIKKVLEFLLSGFPGNWLDILSMKFTVKYWKWKYRGSKSYLFKSSFRFRRNEAKYHPGNFRNMILDKFNEKILYFEKKTQLKLTDES